MLENNVPPRAYTVREAAQALNFCAYTIRAMIRCGELPAFKLGQRWRIPAEAVHALIHSVPQSR